MNESDTLEATDTQVVTQTETPNSVANQENPDTTVEEYKAPQVVQEEIPANRDTHIGGELIRKRGRPRLSEEEKEKRKQEREILRQQGVSVSKGGAVTLEFPVDENYVSRCILPPEDKRRKDIEIWHIYPRVCDYNASLVSDRGVNPREHNEEILHTPIAKLVRKTLTDNPGALELHNRGITILAESVDWKRKSSIAITLADWNSHGSADGATTNYVIANEQREFLGDRMFEDIPEDEWPEHFRIARAHLEVIVNMEDREMIAEFVEARNTSRQVKKFSISNFRGHFDWLKDVLENSKFRGKVGETENTDKPVDILDVISLITLLHPKLNEDKSFNPAIAYASRSRLDSMFVDESLDEGYRALAPIVPDILELRDQIYASFPEVYEQANPDARLGRRKGFDARNHTLPLTGIEATYKIPNAYIMTLLSAFRALVEIKDSKTSWIISPFEFWKNHGAKLMRELLRQSKAVGNSPNMLGKSEIAYSALYREARLLLK